jgi:hypothetical protein
MKKFTRFFFTILTGSMGENFSRNIPPHDVVLLRLTPFK